MEWSEWLNALAGIVKYGKRADDESPKPPSQYESLPEKRPAGRDEFYGSPSEKLLEGRGKYLDSAEMPDNIQQLWRNFDRLKVRPRANTAAYLPDEARIAKRSAIAAAGLDPRRFLLTEGDGYGSSTGAYAGSIDSGYADLKDRSALVHESTHRGMSKIQEDMGMPALPLFSPEKRMRDWWDELATRRLMQRIGAGIEEEGIPPDIKSERDFFKGALDRYLGQLEEHGGVMLKRAGTRGPK